jgi:hypothetical protein
MCLRASAHSAGFSRSRFRHSRIQYDRPPATAVRFACRHWLVPDSRLRPLLANNKNARTGRLLSRERTRGGPIGISLQYQDLRSLRKTGRLHGGRPAIGAPDALILHGTEATSAIGRGSGCPRTERPRDDHDYGLRKERGKPPRRGFLTPLPLTSGGRESRLRAGQAILIGNRWAARSPWTRGRGARRWDRAAGNSRRRGTWRRPSCRSASCSRLRE